MNLQIQNGMDKCFNFIITYLKHWCSFTESDSSGSENEIAFESWGSEDINNIMMVTVTMYR